MTIKRPLLLPAAVSIGAHALLLLGFTSANRDLPAAPDVIGIVLDPPVAVIPKEDPPEPDDASGTPRDDNAEPVPTLPEPVPTKRDDVAIDMPLPPRLSPPAPGAPTKRIPSGWTGEGGKIGGGGPPVLPAHLLDNPPAARYRAAPIYPFEAKREGLRGEVVVEFTVNERGEVLSPRVVSSSSPIFEEATLRAVSKWKFEPGRKDGRPVRFRMSVPVIFSLHE